MTRGAVALRWVLAACALCGCHRGARAGGTCHVPDQLVCATADQALVCDSAQWVGITCRGPHGCAHRGDGDECDDTIAVDGDPCPPNPPLDYACTANRTEALLCKDGRFSLWRECRGPDRCEISDGRVLHCDTTFGERGDPCAPLGTYSCSLDRKAMLVCDGSALAIASSCLGPDGCRVQRDAHKVDCDDSAALEGDPCDRPKRITCSLDRRAVLVCEAGRYVKKRECRRSDCRLDGTELLCD